ncbi:phage tail protein [Sphingomonas panacis]|uniref:Phage tail protein n=1 Tax=Sphingomonas panacis TaxID=1560345 RepID=A0A1B3Z857_9SPHN|nr:tail protein X [Sphingomonas panacis]AOH83614.1 phage tail protein [Sphingomonas panacis]
MADVIRAQQGDTLDALLWRERGLTATDAVRVLEANPGLADRGILLPLGTPVTVPASASPKPRALPLVQLWD